MLIIREAHTGSTRFMEFSAALPGLARTLLSGRLRRLVELGVFEKVPLSETSLYYEYVLTEMGQRLFPVVAAVGRRLSLRRVRAAPLPGRSSHPTPVPLVAVLSADGQPVMPTDTRVVTCEPDGAGQ